MPLLWKALWVSGKELENVISPPEISKAVVSLVKENLNIKTISNKNFYKKLEDKVNFYAHEKLLMKFMTVGTIPDIELENIITELQKLK